MKELGDIPEKACWRYRGDPEEFGTCLGRLLARLGIPGLIVAAEPEGEPPQILATILKKSRIDHHEYMIARKILKKLMQMIRDYRREGKAEAGWSVHTSIAAIPIEHLINGNVDECFYGDDIAKNLPYTCGFMALKWFMNQVENQSEEKYYEDCTVVDEDTDEFTAGDCIEDIEV